VRSSARRGIFYCGGHADHRARPKSTSPARAGTARDRRYHELESSSPSPAPATRCRSRRRRLSLEVVATAQAAGAGRTISCSAPPASFPPASGSCLGAFRLTSCCRSPRHWRGCPTPPRRCGCWPRHGLAPDDPRLMEPRARPARRASASTSANSCAHRRGCERAAKSSSPARRADQSRRRSRPSPCSSGSAFPPASADGSAHPAVEPAWSGGAVARWPGPQRSRTCGGDRGAGHRRRARGAGRREGLQTRAHVGSGATCFGLFTTPRAAVKASRAIKPRTGLVDQTGGAAVRRQR